MPRIYDRVTLVGEANPYGSDPYFALYPAPDGCSGHRLCCLILGMSRADYLSTFDRVNLCPHQWDARGAAARASTLSGRKCILLGSKVARAFELPFHPFTLFRKDTLLVLPHPSRLCRLWNVPGNIDLARRLAEEFCTCK